jgi:SNF2 family DNA or RNA helicase
MTLDQRHASVKKFHTNPEIKIMIAGLKCGGQALNLTCANRVISMDLWWNRMFSSQAALGLCPVYHDANMDHPDSIEQQAFGRVYRIGQHKETFVSRFVAKNTIDQRLLSMQADKIKTIDRAMQDTDASIMEPLSTTDLASLFGHLRE